VTISVDPFAPGFFEDPYTQYRAARESDPVQESPFGPWMLFRYDDVNGVLRDPALSVAQVQDPEFEVRFRELAGRDRSNTPSMLSSDPPDHTRLRRLVQKAFTPRVIEELRPLVQALVDDALDRVAPAGEMDVIGDLAFPLPFTVISRMLGMPDGDVEQLRDWSHAAVKALDPILTDEEATASIRANLAMREHLTGVIAWKRANPADDLLTALIEAEDSGDMLSDSELYEQVALLFVAGHETTVNLIGNGTLALLRHPEQRERLRDGSSVEGNVADELLRFDSPVQFSRRLAVADVEVGGRTIPAGSVILTCLGSANHDPERWGDDADELDLGRPGAGHHLSFGGGVHHCLGAALARLEGQVALTTLVRRFPGIELATDEPAWNNRIVLRGLDALPVSL
jgi:cytochrome P450